MTSPTPTPVREFITPPFAMMFSKSADVGPPKSIFLYGGEGTRKTSMVGDLITIRDSFGNKRFPRGLIIDIDNGTEVFANGRSPEVQQAIDDGFLNIFSIDSEDPDAFGKLEYIINDVNENDYGYDFVSLDTANVAQEVAVKHFLATTFNDKGKPDSRAAWGEVSKWTVKQFRKLHNAPHFLGILVAHSSEGTDDGGAFRIKPKFQGSAKDSVAAVSSIVAYLGFKTNPETKQSSLVATMGENEVITAKNRYMLPNEIENFDLVMLYAMLAERQEGTHTNQAEASPVSVPTTATV